VSQSLRTTALDNCHVLTEHWSSSSVRSINLVTPRTNFSSIQNIPQFISSIVCWYLKPNITVNILIGYYACFVMWTKRTRIGEAMSVYPSAILSAGMFQVENSWTYFDEIWYEFYAIVRRPKLKSSVCLAIDNNNFMEARTFQVGAKLRKCNNLTSVIYTGHSKIVGPNKSDYSNHRKQP
jgi:hypothetical protein